MSSRRGFLKLLGVGAGAAVVAPLAAKVVVPVATAVPGDTLPKVRVLEGELLGPVEPVMTNPYNVTNPHNVTKEQVGLGNVQTRTAEWNLQDLVGSDDLVEQMRMIQQTIR